MPNNSIRIDEIEVPGSAGRPFVFDGVHSGTALSGIDMEIKIYTDADIQSIEELLKKDTVTVGDPFVDRQYEATLARSSSGYQEGRPERWYHFMVKELDEAIPFELLEIEGHTFTVIRNSETLHDDDVIGLNTLLRLSPEEFQEFQSLLRLSQINIRRIGIDEIPVVRRFGGALYWSSHQEGSQRFYKQIARFYPVDPHPGRAGMALMNEQRAQSWMLLALSARYEALVRILVENGQLTQENGEALMSEDWKELISDEREVMIRSKLTEVRDAELELD